jgi:membrane-associated phospholipid phosphatase
LPKPSAIILPTTLLASATRRLSLAVAVAAIAGLVVVRQVGMRWAHELRWETAIGRTTAAHRYDHTPYARALDVVVLAIVPLAAAAVGLWLAARYRRGDRHTAVYGGAILGALAVAETLKQTLVPRPGVPGRLALGYPSGHTTVAIATALVIVLAGPVRRWTLPAAAGLATLVAEGVIIDGWHLPSDVPGGVCLAVAWVALAHAFEPVDTVGRFERRDLLAAAATAAAITLLVLAQPGVPGRLDATRGTLVATLLGGLLAFVAVAAAAHPRRADV